jgi:hypothetical protein
MSEKQPIGTDFHIVLDTEETHVGYTGLRVKYETPTPESGSAPETGFITGVVFGTGTTKIKVFVPQSLWNTLGEWEFISIVDYAGGVISKGKKPFKLTCKGEFD